MLLLLPLDISLRLRVLVSLLLPCCIPLDLIAFSDRPFGYSVCICYLFVIFILLFSFVEVSLYSAGHNLVFFNTTLIVE
jgi:hypothetical protein